LSPYPGIPHPILCFPSSRDFCKRTHCLACGVTPQQVLPALCSTYLFTHYAGHMLVLDETVEHYSAQLR
jgi:hypothetical protein